VQLRPHRRIVEQASATPYCGGPWETGGAVQFGPVRLMTGEPHSCKSRLVADARGS